MELKHAIRKARGERTITQFAKDLNVTRQTIYQWERGFNVPVPALLERMNIMANYKVAREEEIAS